jgi:hypothetical protein
MSSSSYLFPSRKIQPGKMSTGEDIIIEDVVKSKQVPQPEKVQYLSQQTRYGFKSLFSKYAYNASMPYSTQVNPFARIICRIICVQHSNQPGKNENLGHSLF